MAGGLSSAACLLSALLLGCHFSLSSAFLVSPNRGATVQRSASLISLVRGRGDWDVPLSISEAEETETANEFPTEGRRQSLRRLLLMPSAAVAGAGLVRVPPASAMNFRSPEKKIYDVDPVDKKVTVADVEVSVGGERRLMKELLGPKATLVINTGSDATFFRETMLQLKQFALIFQTQGINIVQVPSNSFGDESDNDSNRIRKNLEDKYEITWTVLDKQDVAYGPNQSPLYKRMMSAKGYETDLEWNFVKFLLNKDGRVLRRYLPGVDVMKSGFSDDVDSYIVSARLPKKSKCMVYPWLPTCQQNTRDAFELPLLERGS
uniref:Glutathione peroxidase n=1 Tax=Chromera velia CCMP2878 TaxID=1169474 RepID=A0A0G4I0Q9_9ALVE|eukprot:Cvel_9961.t1-p1 / transcript=Cvel_9961.t1 / gene=Cvel_9961 / organism=Chromera_velia_CCMP2878 / gene_product=Probable phospholipid hydroperoxide glutathione, putative / transcript_product=Probable phospholipid hydroperoxide glutathione, putative / location=Cvel_scaffold590:9705-10661(-) / protein_length=319 / sequence_SO=supercontig / SO=protein_coding / is_pseudo=false